jgi:hypothetical protein
MTRSFQQTGAVAMLSFYHHLNYGIRWNKRGPMPEQKENGDQGKQLNAKPPTDKWDASDCANLSSRQEEGMPNFGLNQASEPQTHEMPVELTSRIILSSLGAKRLARFFKRGHRTV